jgi:hypothetical protein
MNNPGLIETFLASLNPPFAALLLLAGLYSITFCVQDAKTKNHRQAENVARIGGWIYIVLAIAVLTFKLF